MDGTTTNADLVDFSPSELTAISNAVAAWSTTQGAVSAMPTGADWTFTTSTIHDVSYSASQQFAVSLFKSSATFNSQQPDAYAGVAVDYDTSGAPCEPTGARIAVNGTKLMSSVPPTDSIVDPDDGEPWIGHVMMHELGHLLGFRHNDAFPTLMNSLQHFGGNPGDAGGVFYRVTGKEYQGLAIREPAASPGTELNLMLHRFSEMPLTCEAPRDGSVIPDPPAPQAEIVTWKVWNTRTAACYTGFTRGSNIGWEMCESDCKCETSAFCMNNLTAKQSSQCEAEGIEPPHAFLASYISADPMSAPISVKVRIGLIDSPFDSCAAPDALIADKVVMVDSDRPKITGIDWGTISQEGIPHNVPGVDVLPYYRDFYVCAMIDPLSEHAETSESDNQIVSEALMRIHDSEHYCS